MKNAFGTFFKQKRQDKNLTQKQLASLLFVSESTISKWEKNVAHPDITLLPKISEILEVSEHELITASVDDKSRTEKSQAKKWRTLSFSWGLFWYIAYALALIPCFICNLAIDKTLSWFWIVVCSLLLSFTFTNLPKIIKKHKLLLLPLCQFLSLCLLFGVCCIFTNGNWFWVATLSVFLGLVIIFVPIYIAKYKAFLKIRKYNDFVSIAIDFVLLNVLLVVINAFNLNLGWWYFSLALPIASGVYLILNLFLCIRFIKINKLLKTSIILFLIDFILYLPPMFIRIKNPALQNEFNDINVLRANFSNWQIDNVGNNVHLIIFLTLFLLSAVFFVFGIIRHVKKTDK